MAEAKPGLPIGPAAPGRRDGRPAAGTPRLGVVVVNYGSHQLLEENLAPLSREIPGAVVVVVDNFTSSAERDAVRRVAQGHGWMLLQPDRNLGFGAGVNVGAARALELGATELLLLNPDASLDATSVHALLAAVRADPRTVVAPRVLRPDGSVWFAGSDLLLADGRMRATRHRDPQGGERLEPWLSGACLILSAGLWLEVGGFDEDYFLYWEDVDLSHRVLLAGGRLVLEESATARHAEGGTQAPRRNVAGGAEAKSDAYFYYNIRNRLLYAAKHLSDEDLRNWLRSTPSANWQVLLRGGGRRPLLRSPGPMLAALRGTRDGLHIVRQLRGGAPPRPRRRLRRGPAE